MIYERIQIMSFLSIISLIPLTNHSSLLPESTSSSIKYLDESNRQNIDEKDETGLTALMLASLDGRVDAVKDLIKKGADVTIKDDHGWSALMYAISKGNEGVVKALVKSGADVNTADKRSITPLMWATLGGHVSIVETLLDGGADINATADIAGTALTLAEAKGNTKLTRLLRKRGGISSPVNKDSIPKDVAPIDSPPKLLKPAFPKFPDEARGHIDQAKVKLRVLIGADASIKRVERITSMRYGFTEEAVRAAYKQVFSPAMNNGKSIPYWIIVEMEFSIREF